MSVSLVDMTASRDTAIIIHYVAVFLLPPYPVFGALYYIETVSILKGRSLNTTRRLFISEFCCNIRQAHLPWVKLTRLEENSSEGILHLSYRKNANLLFSCSHQNLIVCLYVCLGVQVPVRYSVFYSQWWISWCASHCKWLLQMD